MIYPTIQQYIDSILSAEDNFATLTNLRPVLGDDGNPVMTSGNFAVVFKMHDKDTGKLYAVKCFLKDQPGRTESYKMIADELDFVPSACLTKFKFLEWELFVDTQGDDNEFPMLVMDWVEGVNLDVYLRKHIDDDYALRMLAYRFSKLAVWLMQQPFAHGDLKPENIMVRSNDGSLVLIDYDGMYVPAMRGQRARELGSPDFRHPTRTAEGFGEHIDDFALASILLSLRAIALDASLLERYGAADRLLLSEKDYRDVSSCQLLKNLYPSHDASLNTLISLFTIVLGQGNLHGVSPRLFALPRPEDEGIWNTKVTKEDFANAWIDEYGVEYSKDRKRLLWAPRELHNYTVREGTKVIGDNAFGGDYEMGPEPSLINVSLPDSVIIIGNEAFASCMIERITLPARVTSIGKDAFFCCKSLEKIAIPDSVTSIGEYVFYGCKSLKQITIPPSVTSIGDGCFIGCQCQVTSHSPHFIAKDDILYDKTNRRLVSCYNSKIQQVDISNDVIGIGQSAFIECKSLEQIIIPDGVVTSIGWGAFLDCSSLKQITLPDSVTSIGASVFYRCKSLEQIIIPDGVTKIGTLAFGGCSSIKRITLPDSVTSIGKDAFDGCKSLKQIMIPDNVKEIKDGVLNYYVFSSCSSLQSIFISHATYDRLHKQLSPYVDLIEFTDPSPKQL